ncbi:MAG: YHS domain-containing protein [Gemmataceae bacterium]|nr:YHS domain-containing protein [Gemmataceae bacterium]MDW8243663.1 YHS domain-containing protein [Thermogemmata sp.]
MLFRWLNHLLLSHAIAILASVATANSITIQPSDVPPTPTELEAIKKGLQELQGFIGEWTLEASRKVQGKVEAWKEELRWSWQFPRTGPCLVVEFAQGKGKFFTSGRVTYDPATQKYHLLLHTSDKKELRLQGGVARGTLKVESKDASGDVHRITMTTLAEGIRFQLRYDLQEGGKGLFVNILAWSGNRKGESFAAARKGPECIVSGGAATIPVTYQGKQYFVCCTGCRDEFYANPEKYIAQANKK